MLSFAAAFGAAALWQSQRVRELRAARETAARIQDGELVAGPSGLIEAGWANVIVGRPSGTSPVEVPSQDESQATNSAQQEAPPPGPGDGTSPVVGDYEVTVEAGQTLSEIARAHYGSAARELVRALAKYNSMTDENALRDGQKLRLPALDRLPR